MTSDQMINKYSVRELNEYRLIPTKFTLVQSGAGIIFLQRWGSNQTDNNFSEFFKEDLKDLYKPLYFTFSREYIPE